MFGINLESYLRMLYPWHRAGHQPYILSPVLREHPDVRHGNTQALQLGIGNHPETLKPDLRKHPGVLLAVAVSHIVGVEESETLKPDVREHPKHHAQYHRL